MTKSQLLTIGNNNPVNCNLTISNIEWCAKVKYLGIVVVCNAMFLNVFIDISKQKGKLFSRVISILCATGSASKNLQLFWRESL